MPDPGGDRGKIDGCSGGIVSSVSHSTTCRRPSVMRYVFWTQWLTVLPAAMASVDAAANLCAWLCWYYDFCLPSSVRRPIWRTMTRLHDNMMQVGGLREMSAPRRPDVL